MATEGFSVSRPSGATVYAVIRRSGDNAVWDVGAAAWATFADGNITDYALSLPDVGGDMYAGDFPSAIEVGTSVKVFFYDQAGGTPAITDTILKAPNHDWDGTSLVGPGTVQALCAGALTTLESLKLHMSITGNDDNALLTQLINQVSAKIQTYANRNFGLCDYVEEYEWTAELALNQSPVVGVPRIGESMADVLTITSTDANDLGATFTFTNDRDLTITRTDVNGAEVTHTFNCLTVYKSTAALATAITAIDGWSATATNSPTKHIPPQGGDDFPGGSSNVSAFTSTTNVRAFDADAGVLNLGTVSNWSNSYYGDTWSGRRVQVIYSAGYAPIPADIELLANEMCKNAAKVAARDSTITSENIPDRSVSYGGLSGSEELMNIQARLAPYMRIAIA